MPFQATSIKRLEVPVSWKSVDTANGTFSGLGAAFNNVDLQRDMILPGAFKQTIRDAQEQKSANGGRILWPMLWMHNWEDPVGGIVSARETPDGLAVECFCDLNSDAGRKAFSGVVNGYGTGMSIGYHVKKSILDPKTHVQSLLEVEVGEISLTTTGIAANPRAMAFASSAKSVSALSMTPNMMTVNGKELTFAEAVALVADIMRGTYE